ncbi:MAG: VWA domain-containing protein [Candidatus Sulfotelmatobacter sp.]
MKAIPSLLLFVSGVLWWSGVARAQSATQTPAPATTSATAPSSSPATQTPAPTSTAELNSRDEPTTFKVNVRLVLVRVVARDAKGHAVGNLHKEDFQLFDKGKPQVISHFSEERPGEQVALASKSSEPIGGEPPAEVSTTEISTTKGKTPDVPERFIAFVFDDVHLKFGDLAQVRAAADRHLATLLPTDRVAIFSTSGQTTQDFTDDRAQLHATLLRLQPRPVTSSGVQGCPDVTYYMGDLIENKQDPQALMVATQDALYCAFGGDQRFIQQAQQMAKSAASQALVEGDAESRLALGVLKDVVRRTAVMPGQRNVVLVSPGFLTPQLETDYTEVVDRAVRSQVIINALDARGLYTLLPGGDASSPGSASGGAAAVGLKLQYQTADASANSDVMATLADGTGGTFFQNSNDLDEGLRRVSTAPEYYYVLGFTPQNLKLDGNFHGLKVTVKSPEKLTIQARRGYFAPKHVTDATQEAKEEIDDALFSQEELHDLPVGLHTQFFKSSEADAKLTVLAHVDVKQLRFRKAEGRNWNDLTVVSALFDRNGVFLQGSEKTLQMRLKDETLQNKLGSGITMRASFDVKPGSYLVRLVVRDTEGRLMSAENGAVEIP